MDNDFHFISVNGKTFEISPEVLNDESQWPYEFTLETLEVMSKRVEHLKKLLESKRPAQLN